LAEKKKNLKLDINLQVFFINFDTLKKLAIHNFMKEQFSDGGGSFFDKIYTPALKKAPFSNDSLFKRKQKKSLIITAPPPSSH